MLLRNYDNYQTILSLNHASYSTKFNVNTSVFNDSGLCVKNIQGYNYEPIYYHNVAPFYIWSTGGNGCGTKFTFGSSDTAENYDDYKLTTFVQNTDYSVIFSSLSNTTPVLNEGVWENTVSQTFTALKDLTIKEIGVSQMVGYNSGDETEILIYRKVLETPIEVPANANFVLSFTTKVSANQNKPADYVATASVE